MNRGRAITGIDTFQAQHQLESLRRQAEAQWALMDVLVLPTAGTIFSLADASPDPSATSAKLGLYTNFVNLLDLAAIALPAGFLPAPRNVPWGITLIAPAWSEANLVALGTRFFSEKRGGIYGAAHPEPADPPAAPNTFQSEPRTPICVVGAHLSGQPLNHQLTELDGQLLRRGKTAPLYRLYALANTSPPKPGLVRTRSGEHGAAIDIEVWSLPNPSVASFLTKIPPPLCLGNIHLENGDVVKGFLVEPYAVPGAADISAHGGWLRFLASVTT